VFVDLTVLNGESVGHYHQLEEIITGYIVGFKKRCSDVWQSFSSEIFLSSGFAPV
jgi:hypothetical protein